MRPIDADAVLDWIKRQKESTDRALDVLIAKKTVLTVQTCLSEFEYKVKKQPTAFDVEKVIEQLNELLEEKTSDGGEDWYTAECLAKAIEIVKRGGRDGH